MKRLLSAVLLTLILAGAAFGLSDREYLRMKRNNRSFAAADRKLTRVWNRLQDRMPGWAFRILREEQRDWIAEGRDIAARNYIDDGFSRVEAYTMATNERAEILPMRAREIMNSR